MVRLNEEELQNLKQYGYVLLKNYYPERNTIDVAKSISNIVDIEKIIPNAGISNVHTLTPKEEPEASKSSYSGKYGLRAFPFHTDLAHWATPPRFLMLRCIEGDNTVSTLVLPPDKVAKLATYLPISKAFLSPSNIIKGHSLTALPMMFNINGVIGVRWDKEFLNPINKYAHKVKNGIDQYTLGDWKARSIISNNRGDTIIIDNWRCLHSRSSAPKGSKRLLERVYMDGDL